MPPTDPDLPAVAFPGQGLAKADVAEVLDAHRDHPLVARLAELVGTDGWMGLDWSDTAVVQPCIFTSSYLNATRHLRPDDCAAAVGHSLGEIAALAFLGALDPAAGLELAAERGQLCAARSGAMAAFMQIDRRDLEWVRRRAIAATGEVLEVAAVNGHDQIVMTGGLAAVGEASEAARGIGALVIELAIGGSFHSPLMADAADQLEKVVETVDLAAPTRPFLSTIYARPLDDPAAIRRSLCRGLVLPVDWVATLESLHALGVHRSYDAGPGVTLRKLGDRTGPIRFLPVAAAA